jgi:hypothetical protein
VAESPCCIEKAEGASVWHVDMATGSKAGRTWRSLPLALRKTLQWTWALEKWRVTAGAQGKGQISSFGRFHSAEED